MTAGPVFLPPQPQPQPPSPAPAPDLSPDLPKWARRVARERQARTPAAGPAGDTARLVELERRVRDERQWEAEVQQAASPAALLGRIADALERIAASLEGRS